MQFNNETNPGALPVDGDLVSYELYGRQQMDNWDINVFNRLLDIADELRSGGMTVLQFRKLFTAQEMLSFDNSEFSSTLDPSLKAMLNTVRQELLVAESVNLEDQSVSDALNVMIAAGYLTPERKEEILVGKVV